LKERGKLIGFKIGFAKAELPHQDLTPLEQKTALQILFHLINHGGTLRFRALHRSIFGGNSAINTAIKNLCDADILDDYIEQNKRHRHLSLKETGFKIADRVLEIKELLSYSQGMLL
jgi:DNA-binding HxlR family transcriptional regulator